MELFRGSVLQTSECSKIDRAFAFSFHLIRIYRVHLVYQFIKYVLLEFSLVEDTLAALGKVLQRTEEGIHLRSKAAVKRIRCLDTQKY